MRSFSHVVDDCLVDGHWIVSRGVPNGFYDPHHLSDLSAKSNFRIIFVIENAGGMQMAL